MSRHEGSQRKSTATLAFGSSRREGHDATAFYQRFSPPAISDSTELRHSATEGVIHDDARNISDHVAENSVALVVTSPPYFAGKEYEEALGVDGVPGSYFEYLELLHDVFEQCRTVLEPGGRIAVNVANLGRRPYRSLSADVTGILQDLGLLLRGEVIWWKGRAAGGSCAWGTFQRPGNPVLRDVTERVIIASKGRFDRALTPRQRHDRNWPSVATISRDEFLEATTDLWELPPASATNVGHPAPFPVELPQRLINLYTYRDDLVLDPFMGAGTTGVAAVRTGRRLVGFETDASYVARANERIDDERQRLRAQPSPCSTDVELPAVQSSAETEVRTRSDTRGVSESQAPDEYIQALREGRQASHLAELLLADAGFVHITPNPKLTRLGVDVSFAATDQTGTLWHVDVSGSFTVGAAGLRRADTLWKTLAKAAVLHSESTTASIPLLLLTTDVPKRTSATGKALDALTGPGKPVFDVIQLSHPDHRAQLRQYAQTGPQPTTGPDAN